MKTLYESIFDSEKIIDNMESDVKRMRIIQWFMDHDLDNWGYEFWKNVINFNTDGTIDILLYGDKCINYLKSIGKKCRMLLLNFDNSYPDFIKVKTFSGRILMDITKADKLNIKWFAKHILAPSTIKIVCEDTNELIVPSTIKFDKSSISDTTFNIYSDKLSKIDFNGRTHPSEILLRCKQLNDVNFKYIPNNLTIGVKAELYDKINKLNNDSKGFIEVYALQEGIDLKPKYIGH